MDLSQHRQKQQHVTSRPVDLSAKFDLFNEETFRQSMPCLHVSSITQVLHTDRWHSVACRHSGYQKPTQLPIRVEGISRRKGQSCFAGLRGLKPVAMGVTLIVITTGPRQRRN